MDNDEYNKILKKISNRGPMDNMNFNEEIQDKEYFEDKIEKLEDVIYGLECRIIKLEELYKFFGYIIKDHNIKTLEDYDAAFEKMILKILKKIFSDADQSKNLDISTGVTKSYEIKFQELKTEGYGENGNCDGK